jgi:hypothetical protein
VLAALRKARSCRAVFLLREDDVCGLESASQMHQLIGAPLKEKRCESLVA